MIRTRTLRRLGGVVLLGLAVLAAGCNANVGVGVSVPIFGGWGGPYGGVSIGMGFPIWP